MRKKGVDGKVANVGYWFRIVVIEGYSFAFKFSRHKKKYIFSYPVSPAELIRNVLLNVLVL